MSMSIITLCPSTGGHEAAVESWTRTATCTYPIVVDDTTEGEGAGYLQKLQKFYMTHHAGEGHELILGYMHSDLIIHEQAWDERVLAQFFDDDVAVVSFGGSLRHGHPDIYKVPYAPVQLARSSFISNLTDAEVHGERHTGDKTVAVVDSMAMFVRRSFLDRVGGWPVATYPPSHASDYWACLSAHQLGYRVRMVGVSATHQSGGVGQAGWDYAKWIAGTKWGSDENCHRVAHRLIYDSFRSVLPVVIL